MDLRIRERGTSGRKRLRSGRTELSFPPLRSPPSGSGYIDPAAGTARLRVFAGPEASSIHLDLLSTFLTPVALPAAVAGVAGATPLRWSHGGRPQTPERRFPAALCWASPEEGGGSK